MSFLTINSNCLHPNFRPQTSKGPLLKAVMTSALPVARLTIGEPVALTCCSLPDQPTNRSKVCLGSSSCIADSKAVKETLEGIFDVGPALEECFEFENSPNSIQSVKGRLKVHFAIWADALGANDFILQVTVFCV